MKYYYVLWIPTKKDGKPSICEEPKKKNFQDGWRWGGYFVKGKIDSETYNFTLHYRPHFFRVVFGKWKRVILRLVESNRRGLLLYSVDSEELFNDGFCNALKAKMNPSVYHYIKGCFHTHEFHEASSDALLCPYVTDDPISLRENEREIILFYLEQYKEKFQDFLLYGKSEYEVARSNINSLFHVNEGIHTLAAVISKGNSIKGEQEYFEYLRTHASQQTWISKAFKQDVSEACESIHSFLTDVNNAYNICTAGLGVKYGRWGIVFGLFGIFVSTIGIGFSILNEPDIQSLNHYVDSVTVSAKKELKEHIDEKSKSVTDSISRYKVGNDKKRH